MSDTASPSRGQEAAAAFDLALLDAYSQAVVKAAERVGPAVVHIAGEPVGAQQGRPHSGSGVLIAPDGFVLTNEHLFPGDPDVWVTLADERPYRSEVVSRDAVLDLAVLKIDAAGLPAIDLGEGYWPRVGQVAVAIGNPLGLNWSVSAGVVSAVHRRLSIEGRDLEHLIQTDAAINPGSSGGPLVDSGGRILGITSGKILHAQGLGFAIGIPSVRSAIDRLKRGELITHPYLGIQGHDQLLEPAGSPASRRSAVLVLSVEEGSPAAGAGLRPFDIILSLSGRAVGGMAELKSWLLELPVGAPLPLRVLRGEQESDLRVVLGDRSAE